MSTAFLLGVFGELPTVAKLRELLADLGDVRGSWSRGIDAAGVGVHRETDKATRARVVAAVRRRLRRRAAAPEVSAVVRIGEADLETVDAVSGALAHQAGGVLFVEDLSVRGELIEPAARAAKQPRSAIDLTVPNGAGKRLASPPWALTGTILDYSHVLYRLASRHDSDVQWGRLVAKLPEHAHVAYSSGSRHISSKLVVGGLELSGAKAGYVKFRHWHQQVADPEDWDFALRLMSGVARLTGGVLYRDCDPASYVDFAPDRPLPDALAAPSRDVRWLQRAPDDATLANHGDRAVVRWNRLDSDAAGEDVLEVGGKRTHPALEMLVGTRPGDRFVVRAMNYAGVEQRRPPGSPTGVTELEIEIVEVRRRA